MLALLGFILVILGSTAVRPVAAAEGNLPGGTSLTVELTGPADAAVIPAGTDSLAVAGTASIGQGPTLANTLIVYVLDVSGSVNTVGEGCGGDANGELTVSVSAIVASGETSGISAASVLCSLWGRSTSGSEAVGDVDSTYIYRRMLKAISNGATIFRVRIYILIVPPLIPLEKLRASVLGRLR